MEAPESGDDEGLTGDEITPVIEEETEPVDDMQGEEPVVDEEEPTEPVKEEDAANTPMDVEAYSLTAADVVAPTGEGFTYEAGENANVETNGFTFTVTAKDGYTVDAVKYQIGEATAEKITGSNNEYIIPKEVFTDTAAETKVKILVEATRIQYTVTPIVTVSGNDVTADIANNDTVEFSWNTATTGADEGKIYAGDNLTFTAKLKAGKDAEYSISVSYKVGTNDIVTPAIANNGVYTISNVSGDVAINVTVAPLKQCVITVAENDGIKEFTYLKDGKYVAYGENDKPTVTENQSFSFKVTPATYYKIDKVTVNGVAVTAKNSVYTSKITDDTTINVETSVDANQCNTVTLALDKTSDLKSAKATVVSISANDLDSDINKQKGSVIEAGGTLTFPGDTVTLKIEPKNGYTITQVNGADAKPDAEGAVEYKVNKFTSKKATVTVATDTKASVSENALVTFEMNNAPKLSYKVTGDNITAVEGAANQYQTSKDTKRLKFTITATGSYLPIVTQATITTEGGTAGEAVPVEASKTTATKTGTTYDYVIPVSQLGYSATFAITQEDDSRMVTIGGEGADNVEIVASINGMKRNPNTGETKKYTVLLNDVVTLQIKAGTNSDLTEVVSKVGTKETKAKIANNTATLEVKVTDNTEINITTKDQYVASKLTQVKGSEKTELNPVGATNSYNVAYDGIYEASVAKGASLTEVTLSDVKVLQGKNTVAAAEGKPAVGSIADKVATIDLNNAVTTAIAGKTLTVELYAKEGTGEDARDVKVATYSLIVSAPAKDIKINKSANLTVTQAIDTKKTYTVTAAKGVDLNTLEAKSDDTTNSIISDMDYTNGILTVTLAAKDPAEGAKATITIAAKGAAETDPNKATIVITPVKLIADNAKAPTVKLIAASDISFKLALSAKTEEAVSKNLYYKVVTSTETVSDNDITVKSEKITYIPKSGDSQNAQVYVSDKTVLGTGDAATYTVTASVVHANKKVGENETLAKEDTLGTSVASKAQTFKTQKPAYEDKLKLQKGKTTIVTGEQDIVIAKPQFNKYTTYATLDDADAVKDITAGLNDTQKLNVRAVEDELGNYEIWASADANTWVGKHKIQVTASAEGGAYASVATIDVTVVRGIHKLDVTVPSTNLYKANKKAAKVKATVLYNQDITTSSAPKNKNVTWEIVGADGKDLPDGSYIKKMVTVKNGTVTVDKSFIVDTVEANNQFKIKVTANNEKSFAGGTYNGDKLEPIVGESPVITITGAGEDIKTLAIVQGQKWSDSTEDYETYVVKARPTGNKEATKVFAEDLKDAKVVAFTSKADESKTEYTPEELKAATIDLNLLTLKSSNQKSVPVWEGGWITVNKVGKVKLTATANDGSKNKAELSLDILNDETEGTLGLRMYEAEYDKNGQPQPKTEDNGWKQFFNPDVASDTNISYDFSETPVVLLQVQQQVTEDGSTYYTTVPDFANFNLTVTGGKFVQQKGTEAYVAMNSKTVTVKLTDKSKKSDNVVTYVLTNDGAEVKPTFKAKNKLYSKGTADEQIADIDVSKLTNFEANENLVAKVAVDWSAKNTKNEKDLKDLAGILEDEYILDTVKENKSKFTLSFKSSGTDAEIISLNQKSYKLTVTLYEKNEVSATEEGAEASVTYTAVTSPTSMTVSVDSAKKFTFKPTTSYTLTTKDAKANAPLTGKASVTDYTVKWENLQNLNTKGVTNKFAEYFNVVDDGEGNYSIKLAKLNGDALPDKADCTGYITYTATAEKNYYSDKIVSGTVKITVKLDDKKTVATYSQGKIDNKLPEIGPTKESTTTTRIDAKIGKNSSPAKLSYVTVDSNDTVSKDFAVAKAATDGNLSLTYNGDGLVKNKTYKVKLYIVPEGSYYKEIIATAESANSEDSEAVATLTARYGILVTVQVKAVEAPSVAKTYEVTITEGADSVVAGSNTETYKATVTEDGKALENPTVTWSVTGGTGATTGIGENTGVLTVDDSEEAETVLTITATYKPEGADAVTGTKTVTVTAADGNGGN